MNDKTTFGIDYGSKMAGTTVVAYLEENRLRWLASEKKQDADRMILKAIDSLKAGLIAIDAPLSLPGVYTAVEGCDDHFYRQCDKETKAMSPMFLGGLTARAIKLKSQASDARFIEAYPVKTGKELGLEKYGFRTNTSEYSKILLAIAELTSWDIDHTDATVTGHHIDAALALYTAHRFLTNEAQCLGNPLEGLIFF